jgi:hypothetical protein
LREIVDRKLSRTLVATIADPSRREALLTPPRAPGEPFDREWRATDESELERRPNHRYRARQR